MGCNEHSLIYTRSISEALFLYLSLLFTNHCPVSFPCTSLKPGATTPQSSPGSRFAWLSLTPLWDDSVLASATFSSSLAWLPSAVFHLCSVIFAGLASPVLLFSFGPQGLSSALFPSLTALSSGLWLHPLQGLLPLLTLPPACSWVPSGHFPLPVDTLKTRLWGPQTYRALHVVDTQERTVKRINGSILRLSEPELEACRTSCLTGERAVSPCCLACESPPPTVSASAHRAAPSSPMIDLILRL